MANELNIPLDPNTQSDLSVEARLYSAGAQVGSDIALTESGSTAYYSGDVPGGTAAGKYDVGFYNATTGDQVGTGGIEWSGTAEVTVASRLAGTVLSGITSLANWLRAGKRSSTPDATALSEINTGGGTYDATTDSQEAIGAGGNLTITPVQAVAHNPRFSTRDLPPIAQHSAPAETWVITDGAGTPIDLSAKSLRLTVAAVTDEGEADSRYDDVLEGEWQYTTGGGGLTVGGASNNQVTLQHDPANNGTPGLYRYWLWDVTTANPYVLVKGKLPIEPAVREVA